MTEKVHQEKLQGVQTRLTYGESSQRNSQTREKTQLSQSESCDTKRRSKKSRKPNPSAMSRGYYPSQRPSVFSRLKQGEQSSSRPRSPISTMNFTRLGEREKNVFTWLEEREKGVFTCLRLGNTSRCKHASARRDVSTGRAVRDPDRRIRKARNLVRSYVTCSSERQREIKREWDATDRANRRKPTQEEECYLSESENDGGGHWKSKKSKSTTNEEDLSQPWFYEETNPFTIRMRNYEFPKRIACQPMSKHMAGLETRNIASKFSRQQPRWNDEPFLDGATCSTLL
ncbi:hypothetical protein Tco_0670160 [Tanacetum coccineum]